MSVEDMYNHVLSGYTITGDYGFSEEFKIGRTKDNWKGSQFLYIDLDGVDIDWNTLNVKLNNSSIVPTFTYTTYSHGLPGKGNRYRIVYLFDETITSQTLFFDVATYYNRQVSSVLGIDNGIDSCNKTVNQIMHGTKRFAKSCYNGAIVNLESIINNLPKEQEEINAKSSTKKKATKLDPVTKELADKLYRSYSDYLYANRNKYQLYTDNWNQLGSSAKKKDIIDVKPLQRYNKSTDNAYIYKLSDGSRRRKILLTCARRIRVINPNVTREELQYNIVNYLFKYMINNGNLIDWKEIDRILNITMNEDYKNYLVQREKQLGEKANKIIANPYLIKKKEPVNVRDRFTIEEIIHAVSCENINEGIAMLGCSRRTFFNLKKEFLGKKNSKEVVKVLYIIYKYKPKQIMEITKLSKSQVYRIIKELKEAGIEVAKVDIEINHIDNRNFTDYGNYNYGIDIDVFNFGGKEMKKLSKTDVIKEFSNTVPKIKKYFKDGDSMNELLGRYVLIPRMNVLQSKSKTTEINMKITPYKDSLNAKNHRTPPNQENNTN